jgi:hypothetical protein
VRGSRSSWGVNMMISELRGKKVKLIHTCHKHPLGKREIAALRRKPYDIFAQSNKCGVTRQQPVNNIEMVVTIFLDVMQCSPYLHGIISQKMETFITAIVRTSNIKTEIWCFLHSPC